MLLVGEIRSQYGDHWVFCWLSILQLLSLRTLPACHGWRCQCFLLLNMGKTIHFCFNILICCYFSISIRLLRGIDLELLQENVLRYLADVFNAVCARLRSHWLKHVWHQLVLEHSNIQLFLGLVLWEWRLWRWLDAINNNLLRVNSSHTLA